MASTQAHIAWSGHALDRLEGRCPDVIPAHARTEIEEAIGAGRMGRTCPVWAKSRRFSRRPKLATKTGLRYVWNDESTRCYLVNVSRRPMWVVTVLTPDYRDE